MATLLMERSYAGVDVFMFWHGATSCTMNLIDPLGVETVTIPAAEVLDAFHHPYLYLDASRPDPFSPRLRSEDDAEILSADAQDAPLGTLNPDE